jgi:type 1 glutamine amidotransferase
MSGRLARALAAAVLLAGVAVAAGGAANGSDGAAARGMEDPSRVLVFSKTASFRHASIPVGIAAIEQLGAENGFEVVATEDSNAFKGPYLRRFDAVVFLLTTGDVLDDRRQLSLKRFIKRGGGYAGIHSASDTEHEWPYYGGIVGARFKSHPIQQTASFDNEAPDHPATKHLAERFTVFDEFYSFNRNPRPYVRVLLTIDESTYSPDPNTTNLPGGTPATGVMGDHPMAWCHTKRGSRVFYTALGHEPYLYETPWFLRHILAGIQYASGDIEADCEPRTNSAD